jgi:hypothetical protein
VTSEDPFTRDAGKTRSDELEEGRDAPGAAESEGWPDEEVVENEPEPGASGDEMGEDNDGGPPATQQRPGGPY